MVRVLPFFFFFLLLLALLCCHHKCKGDFGVATFDDLWLLCRRFLATRTSWHWNPWDRRTLGNTFAVPLCHVLEQGRRRFLLLSMVSCNICMYYTKTGIDTPARSCEMQIKVWVFRSEVNASRKTATCHKILYPASFVVHINLPLCSFQQNIWLHFSPRVFFIECIRFLETANFIKHKPAYTAKERSIKWCSCKWILLTKVTR